VSHRENESLREDQRHVTDKNASLGVVIGDGLHQQTRVGVVAVELGALGSRQRILDGQRIDREPLRTAGQFRLRWVDEADPLERPRYVVGVPVGEFESTSDAMTAAVYRIFDEHAPQNTAPVQRLTTQHRP